MLFVFPIWRQIRFVCKFLHCPIWNARSVLGVDWLSRFIFPLGPGNVLKQPQIASMGVARMG